MRVPGGELLSMETGAEKARRECCGRGEYWRHEEDETGQRESLEVKLKRAPLHFRCARGPSCFVGPTRAHAAERVLHNAELGRPMCLRKL